MRAALGVQALVGQAQPLNGATGEQVFVHNRRCVSGLDVAVSNCFGVDHHHWPVLALVQTAGFVDTYAVAKTSCVDSFLQFSVQGAGSVASAGGTRCALGSRVAADKDVVIECGQGAYSPVSIEDSYLKSPQSHRPVAGASKPQKTRTRNGRTSPPHHSHERWWSGIRRPFRCGLHACRSTYLIVSIPGLTISRTLRIALDSGIHPGNRAHISCSIGGWRCSVEIIYSIIGFAPVTGL